MGAGGGGVQGVMRGKNQCAHTPTLPAGDTQVTHTLRAVEDVEDVTKLHTDPNMSGE